MDINENKDENVLEPILPMENGGASEKDNSELTNTAEQDKLLQLYKDLQLDSTNENKVRKETSEAFNLNDFF